MVNQMIQMNSSGQMGMQGMQSMQMPMQMGQPNHMMHAGSGPLMMPVQTGGMGGQQRHWSLNHHSGPGQHPFGKGSGKYNRVGNVGPDNDLSWRSRPMDGGSKNDAAMFLSRSEVTSSMKRRSESAEVSSGGSFEAKAPVSVAGHVNVRETKVASEPGDEDEEAESEPAEADENEEVEGEVSEVPDEQSEQEEAEDDEHEEAEDGVKEEAEEDELEEADEQEEAEDDDPEEAEDGVKEEAEEDELEEAEGDEQEEAEDDDQEEAEDGVQEEATRNEQDAEDHQEEATRKEKAGVCKGNTVVLGLKVSTLDKRGKLSLEVREGEHFQRAF